MRRILRLWLVIAVALSGLQGCAALALPALMPEAVNSAVGAGTGSAVKAGTEHRSNGLVVRTFDAPLAEVHVGILETLNRLKTSVQRNEVDATGGLIIAVAGRRTVDIQLESITPELTSMRLVVKGPRFLARDRATATQILAQIEQTLDRDFPSAFPK
jgi:hypothetical protein